MANTLMPLLGTPSIRLRQVRVRRKERILLGFRGAAGRIDVVVISIMKNEGFRKAVLKGHAALRPIV